MDKKSQFLYQFRAFFVNSNSIPIPFFSIPIPSPIPGIESGIELNSHSIPELTPTLLASHVMLSWAVESGCTRSVALANICFDSENADSASLFHFKSKFDFGDSLVWPSLAEVSRLLSGVSFAAQCGMKQW